MPKESYRYPCVIRRAAQKGLINDTADFTTRDIIKWSKDHNKTIILIQMVESGFHDGDEGFDKGSSLKKIWHFS